MATHSAAAKPLLDVLFQDCPAFERMVATAMNDADTSVTFLKTVTDESLEAASGLGDAQPVKVEVSFDDKVTLA
jgi:hypothetical protein